MNRLRLVAIRALLGLAGMAILLSTIAQLLE